MSKIPYVITDRTATLYIGGEEYPIDRSTAGFEKLTLELSKEVHDVPAIRSILRQFESSDIEVIDKGHEGRIEVKRRGVYYDGRLVNSALASRMIDIQQAGLPLDPWIKLMANIYANPADYAQDEFYMWLEKSTLPITEDGHFLAYKKVRANFTDIHSGKFDNSPGEVVVMPGGRLAVDNDRNRTCSVGLHFCSKSYLPHFGHSAENKVVLVKVNPADVVSIPSDYGNAKGRAWKYEVISEVTFDHQKHEFPPITNDDGTDWFRFDPEGFDKDGFDKDGLDEDGYTRDGFLDGYDEWGYDELGFDRDGYDGSGYDEDGYDSDGLNEEGYDSDGRDEDGYDYDGYDSYGYDYEDRDPGGYDRDGYDCAGYDEDGYDENGRDEDGDKAADSQPQPTGPPLANDQGVLKANYNEIVIGGVTYKIG
jgi:hypothetical protein